MYWIRKSRRWKRPWKCTNWPCKIRNGKVVSYRNWKWTYDPSDNNCNRPNRIWLPYGNRSVPITKDGCKKILSSYNGPKPPPIRINKIDRYYNRNWIMYDKKWRKPSCGTKKKIHGIGCNSKKKKRPWRYNYKTWRTWRGNWRISTKGKRKLYDKWVSS